MADVAVSVHQVAPRILAAVRREVTIGDVASASRPALDQVWQFLRTQPGLHAGGHNVFLYHHPSHRSAPMPVDFGVEVTRPFEASGDVRATQTPAGEVARATHVGPYHRLKETHTRSTLGPRAITVRSAATPGKFTATGPTTNPSSKRRSSTCLHEHAALECANRPSRRT